MARNPFNERTSEQTTTDKRFALQFSPEALERLPEDAFSSKLTWIYSPPGGGKTSLLRLMTPGVLNELRRAPDDRTKDTKNRLVRDGVIRDGEPDFLGVYANCATGYGEIPPGLDDHQANALFRALVNCRIVGRAIRAALEALDIRDPDRIHVSWSHCTRQPNHVPADVSGTELLAWADHLERQIYGALDSLGPQSGHALPQHLRFEVIDWLGSARFLLDGAEVLTHRLLMLDNVHDLPRDQRKLLSHELAQIRSEVPIWLAARTLILDEAVLAPRARVGRDVAAIYLEEAWRTQSGGVNFEKFALAVAHRRTQDDQTLGGSFNSCLSTDVSRDEADEWEGARVQLHEELAEQVRRSEGRYDQWVEAVGRGSSHDPRQEAIECQEIAIVIARDQSRRQLELDLRELTAEELTAHSGADIRGAAEVMIARRFRKPYFYGPKRITALASFNVEEFLSIAAKLYGRLDAKNTLRKRIDLTATEQNRIALEVGKERFDSIPKAYGEGRRIQNLLHGLGQFLARNTHQATAPYAPGATGIGFDERRMNRLLRAERDRPDLVALRNILRECVAENLLFRRENVKQGGREWTILYINRLIGSLYMLPCSLGGWRPADLDLLAEWVESPSARQKEL